MGRPAAAAADDDSWRPSLEALEGNLTKLYWIEVIRWCYILCTVLHCTSVPAATRRRRRRRRRRRFYSIMPV